MATDRTHIQRDRVLPEALDYKELLKLGIARAQATSGGIWTDYNVHDPGVTILDHVCFALTDIAYRADHPVEDILATLFGTDARPAPQTFPLPHEILTTAPVTEADLRAVICDEVPEVRGFWIDQGAGDGECGVFSADGTPADRCLVSIYLFDPPSGRAPSPDDIERVRLHVEDVLRHNRALGQVFAPVEVVKAKPVSIATKIGAEDGYDSNDLIAAVLHRIEIALCPPVVFGRVDERLAALPVDAVFDGPDLNHGIAIQSTPLPLSDRLADSEIRNLILTTPGVARVLSLEVDWGDARDNDVFRIERNASSYQKIEVLRDGRPAVSDLVVAEGQTLQNTRLSGSLTERHITASLTHRMERLRWTRKHDKMNVAEGLGVPEGKRRQQLGTYRTIQHDFPAIYELAPDSEVGATRFPHLTGKGETRSARTVRIRNLRNYLALFEQPMADMLQQLCNAPRLLGGQDFPGQTYFHGSLMPEFEGDPNAPPSFGAGLKYPGTYDAKMNEFVQRPDPHGLRYEVILDHLLARFDEEFRTWRLEQFAGAAPSDKLAAAKTRIESKQTFLRKIAELGARRGMAATNAHTAPALATRMRLKAGLEADPIVIEHGQFADMEPVTDPAGFFTFTGTIGTMALHATAVRVASGPTKHYGMLYAKRAWTTEDELQHQVRDAFACRTAKLLAKHTDQVGCVLFDPAVPDLPRFELLDLFQTAAAAETAVRALLTDARHGAISPVLFPVPFCAPRLTLLLDSAVLDKSDEYKQIVEAIAEYEAPAHLDLVCGWPDDLKCSTNAYLLDSFEQISGEVWKWRSRGGPVPAAIVRSIAEIGFRRHIARLKKSWP